MSLPHLLPPGAIVLLPGEGRQYDCGPMRSIFLADSAESGDRYSASIWYVAPHRSGPGAHSHEHNEELFYVFEGTMTFLVGDQHIVTHDFENNTPHRTGVFNVFIPGGFESNMAAIVEWYRSLDQS